MKKVISLLLALVLSLSLVGCGKSEPVPEPAQTLNALLLAVFQEDPTGMGQLFGYTSYEAVMADWLNGDDPRDLLLDAFVNEFAASALSEGITVDDTLVNELADAIIDALARAPFTCTTDTLDEANGIAIVSVSITPFPETCLDDAALTYIYTNYLDKLLAAGDDAAAMYEVIFTALTQYAQQLQPVGEAVSFTVPCTLVETSVNGRTRSCWVPSDAESLGEQFVLTVFDLA